MPSSDYVRAVRKLAAWHQDNQVKKAQLDRMLPWLLGGAALGGLTGYFGSQSEDEDGRDLRVRNALLGALAGAGLGGGTSAMLASFPPSSAGAADSKNVGPSGKPDFLAPNAGPGAANAPMSKDQLKKLLLQSSTKLQELESPSVTELPIHGLGYLWDKFPMTTAGLVGGTALSGYNLYNQSRTVPGAQITHAIRGWRGDPTAYYSTARRTLFDQVKELQKTFESSTAVPEKIQLTVDPSNLQNAPKDYKNIVAQLQKDMENAYDQLRNNNRYTPAQQAELARIQTIEAVSNQLPGVPQPQRTWKEWFLGKRPVDAPMKELLETGSISLPDASGKKITTSLFNAGELERFREDVFKNFSGSSPSKSPPKTPAAPAVGYRSLIPRSSTIRTAPASSLALLAVPTGLGFLLDTYGAYVGRNAQLAAEKARAKSLLDAYSRQ